MALTTLDPITALIVVDPQSGIVGLPLIHAIADVVTHSGALATFRRRRPPVLLVNVDGGAPDRTERPCPGGPFPDGWTDLIPELDKQPNDIVVTKRTWDSFASDLESRLKTRAQVAITGVATATGVESTGRQASEAGFNVTLATDVTTDVRPDAHVYSIGNVFPRLGETGSTQSVIDLLEGRTHELA